MGTDYSSESAIIVDLESMIGLINGKNKKATLEVIQSFVDKIMADQYTSEETKEWLKKLDKIPSNIKLGELKEKLREFHAIKGSAGKYDGDCHFANGMWGEDMMILWEDVIDVSNIVLPDLDQIRIFDSYRQQVDCPLEEVSFCFNAEDCYEKKLNQTGKNLEKIAGNLWETSWTTVSY
tara:strand:+ start:51 stop:587 length:537 start_codon:yes stop_codon:yes gene_type:complete